MKTSQSVLQMLMAISVLIWIIAGDSSMFEMWSLVFLFGIQYHAAKLAHRNDNPVLYYATGGKVYKLSDGNHEEMVSESSDIDMIQVGN